MARHRRRHRSRRATSLTHAGATVVLAMAVLVLLGGGGAAMANSLASPAVDLALLAGAGLLGYAALRYRHRRRLRVQTLADLLLLTPAGFEGAVANLLRDLGYRQVRRVGRAGDLAADITCRDSEGRSLVVQCKRYAPGHRIGSPEIQKFIGMLVVEHRVDRGMFVTTSQFTEPATSLARRHGVVLVDDERLVDLMVQARKGGRLPVDVASPVLPA